MFFKVVQTDLDFLNVLCLKFMVGQGEFVLFKKLLRSFIITGYRKTSFTTIRDQKPY